MNGDPRIMNSDGVHQGIFEQAHWLHFRGRVFCLSSQSGLHQRCKVRTPDHCVVEGKNRDETSSRVAKIFSLFRCTVNFEASFLYLSHALNKQLISI